MMLATVKQLKHYSSSDRHFSDIFKPVKAESIASPSNTFPFMVAFVKSKHILYDGFDDFTTEEDLFFLLVDEDVSCAPIE